MAFSVNKVTILGNLGQDPQVKTLGNGAKLASFTVATTESYKDKEGNYKDRTEWHRIVSWRWLADLVEKHLKKGSKVYIEGKLSTRSYEQEGVQKYTTEIVAREIITMSGDKTTHRNSPPVPNEEPLQQTNKPQKQEITPNGEVINYNESDDDLPF